MIMKRTGKTHANHPRVRLLPACLSLALAVGSGAFAPERSEAAMPPTPAVIPAGGPFAPDRNAQRTPMRQSELAAFMQSKARTLPVIPAASIPVTNCNDSGPGSYRQAMTDAANGDTIDLTSLDCSTITLTTGDVITGVDDLTLQGPGALALTISGGGIYRPLHHIGFGHLSVNDVSIADGKKYVADGGIGNPDGGCISSTGDVAINNSWIKYCDAGSSSVSNPVKGGAVYGQVGVGIVNSVISGSTAHSSGTNAMGGGVYTPGYLTIAYSQIADNSVIASGRSTGGGAQVGNFYGVPGDDTFVKYSTFSGNSAGAGGGLYSTGDIFITNSTISHNAGGNTGGILMFNLGGATGEWKLMNSTVSGNDSNILTGGVYVRGNDARIENSTIAFNDSIGSNKYGAGVTVRSTHNLHLNSTLVSNNYTDVLGDELGPQVDDIGGVDGATLTGTDNLIYFPSSLVTPPGTILLTDPALAPLAANGGPTATHGLYPSSPALDAGNNTQGTLTDQRGTGYPRNIGPSPDIGAFEGTVSDTIFTDGFD